MGDFTVRIFGSSAPELLMTSMGEPIAAVTLKEEGGNWIVSTRSERMFLDWVRTIDKQGRQYEVLGHQ